MIITSFGLFLGAAHNTSPEGISQLLVMFLLPFAVCVYPAGRVVDLAAVGPGNTVYVVEVKASRSDFARDNHTRKDLAALKAQNGGYTARMQLAKETLVQAASFARSQQPQGWREVPAYRNALALYRRMVRHLGRPCGPLG